MVIINKLEFKKDKHISTRIIKTFSERKQAEQYLENCLMLSTYIPTEEKYELKEI